MLIKHEPSPRARFTSFVTGGRVSVITALCVTSLTLAGCDTDDGRQMREPTNTIPPTVVTTPTATATDSSTPVSVGTLDDSSPQVNLALVAPWQNGAAIPALYTCDGDEVSPALHWAAGPDATVEFAISIVDPDAGGFVHWVVTGIDPATTSIAQGSLPPGVTTGLNSAGEASYAGPCPPAGETHNYVVTVYALSQQLELAADEQPAEVVATMDATSLTRSTLSGTYTRAG